MESLHSDVRIVWGVGALLSAIFVGSVVGVVDRVLLHVGVWLGPVAGAVVVVLALPFAVARYRVWRFEIQSDALYLEHGVITRIESAVPYVRVQHIDTQRGPVERLAGLASIVVYTAGSRGADVTIPGLKPERAAEIQDQLRELANESEDDAV